MDRLLARLERRLGRFAIPNLVSLIVGGMGIAFVLSLARPDFLGLLTLDLHEVLRGQVWRLVTYLFLPTSSSIIWVLFALYWTWLIGTNLENDWGAFKFNAFYLIGMIGTTIAAAITGHAQGSLWLNSSLFLAFATVFPNYQILLFFVLPVKVKWLGIVSAVMILGSFVMGDWAERGAIIAATGNYLLFFGEHLWGMWRGRNLKVRQAAKRASLRPVAGPVVTARACAICGAREDEGADIRVCSCAKCGGPRNLCLPHARAH